MIVLFFISFCFGILLFIIGWICYLLRKDISVTQIIVRLLIAAGMFIAFIVLSVVIIAASLFWFSDRNGRTDSYPYSSFEINNQSSVSLLVDADFAYSLGEIEDLKRRNIYIDPQINFVVYRNVSIKSPDSYHYKNFTLAVPRYADSVALPRNMYVCFKTIQGEEIFTIDIHNAGHYITKTHHNYECVISDSLLWAKGVNTDRVIEIDLITSEAQ